MTGHAPHLLFDCERCPAWEPKRATAVNDAGEKVCTPHALDTCADLVGAR